MVVKGAKILVIGSGGREHSLGWKLNQSAKVSQLYFAPGNGGTTQIGTNIPIEMTDVPGLLNFAKKMAIDFTVVGPEAALEAGVVDTFNSAGLRIFGPTKAAAQIETSKAFAHDFMLRYKIPQPDSQTVDSLKAALAYVSAHRAQDYVIKADGLAAGKGVILPSSQQQAETWVKNMLSGKAFGVAGTKIVFQERLYGQETSVFALSDGSRIVMLPFFQDHKPIFDGDKGPNTGGIGAYSPVPIVTQALAKTIRDTIMQPAIDGLARDGIPYQGVLYGGLMITPTGPKVIEFNARFGDPECEPQMMLLEEDLYDLLEQCAQGRLKITRLKSPKRAVANIVLTSKGYPGDYPKGLPITGIEEAEADFGVRVFHAGTLKQANKLVTNGGRVLDVTAIAPTLPDALKKAYTAVKKIHFDGMHYRSDIGAQALSTPQAIND